LTLSRSDSHEIQVNYKLMTLQPDFVAPVVGYLVSKGLSSCQSFQAHLIFPPSDNVETTGSLFEVSGGWAAKTRWQQAGGHGFPVNKKLSPEDVIAKWKNIINFGELLFRALSV
jgi:multifunctional beta-oxidation protein